MSKKDIVHRLNEIFKNRDDISYFCGVNGNDPNKVIKFLNDIIKFSFVYKDFTEEELTMGMILAEIEKIDDKKYPGIKEMIQELQEKHPSWKFKVLYTGIDWNDAIVNEYTGHGDSPKNLVPVGTAFTFRF